jgi:hypothetical protein
VGNYFTSITLPVELRSKGVGACGTARSNLKGFPNELDIGKKIKCSTDQIFVLGRTE